MTIEVEPHQCTSHQFIILTQGPIPEIFVKKIMRIGEIEKLNFFESAILILIFLLHPNEDQSKFIGNFDDYSCPKVCNTV